MNTTTNMLLNRTYIETDIKNKGFSLLHNTFKEQGWKLIKNEFNSIYYIKPGDETSYFNIEISTDKITVSVPIKQSVYQFVTTFKSYYQASEYIEQKIYEYN